MTATHLLIRFALPSDTVVVLTLTLGLLSTAQHVKDNSVSCEILSVYPLDNSSVTCHFPEDVSQTRRDFTVSFSEEKNWQDYKDVLDCWWLSGKMDCVIWPGYTFNRLISENLTLEIPHVSTEHIGRYACKLSNMNPDDIKPCELKKKLSPTVISFCNISSVKETEPASLTCTFNIDVYALRRNFSVVRLGGVEGEVVDIVKCAWLEDQLSCTTAPRYEFNNTFKEKILITIPQASRDHNAAYSCHVMGYNIEAFASCYFAAMSALSTTNVVIISVIIVLTAVSLVVFIIGIFLNYRQRCTGGALIVPCDDAIPAAEMTRLSSEVPDENESLLSKPILSEDDLQRIYRDNIQAFWLTWVEAAFPDLESQTYFLAPVYVNHVPLETMAPETLLVQSAPQQDDQQAMVPSDVTRYSVQPSFLQTSEVKDDAAIQQVFTCLKTYFKQNSEVMVGISQLQFQEYPGNFRIPYYGVSDTCLSVPEILPPDLIHSVNTGTCDLLLVHKRYGLIACQVRSHGHNFKNSAQQDNYEHIKKSITEVISELDKAEAILSHRVSDIAPGLRITKMIALPNLTAAQIHQAISDDQQLTQKLCGCLGTRDAADIAGLCLCSDQLSDPKTPCDVSSHVLRELGHWWQRRVAGAGPDSHMTPELYKTLVARLCGPATTVSVPCTCPPRVSVKTLGQAVWCTGECYTAVITLFPEQVYLLNTAPPTLFVTGPPGTGKTLVLLMMGIKWLRCGHPVYIVSTCKRSRAACIMLYHLLLQTVKTQQSAGVSPGQPHLLQYDLKDGKDEEKAVNDLSQAASGGSLYVIADEVGPDVISRHFHTFCKKLRIQVPRLHLWAASCYHGHAPDGWQEESLTRPLRSPLAVVKEVEQNAYITEHRLVKPYSERGVLNHTDGHPVIRLYHEGQGHSGLYPEDCVTCGTEVASLLHSLQNVSENITTPSTSTGDSTTQPCLQWRDVLVLSWTILTDKSGMVKGLKEAGIPVRMMEDDDIEDVATARSDVVWVARGDNIRGLERKVVVCLKNSDDLDDDVELRLYMMSRCTAQLVIVSPDMEPASHPPPVVVFQDVITS